MRITFDQTVRSVRHALNRDFQSLNKTTNMLLRQTGTFRASANASTGSLVELTWSDLNAAGDAASAAAETITMNQTADAVMSTLQSKLYEMRDLIERVLTEDHTMPEKKDIESDYNVLADEVDALLANSSYGGQSLFGGNDPPVALSLSSGYLTGLKLSKIDPEDAQPMSQATLAMTEIDLARSNLDMENARLELTIDDLSKQSDKLLSFGMRLNTAQEALNVLASVTSQMISAVVLSVSTQANILPSVASSLLA